MDLRAASQGCLRASFWHVSPLGMFPRGLLFGVVWRIRAAAAGLPNRIFPQSVVKSPLGFLPACLPTQLQKWPKASFGMDPRAAIQVGVRASFWHVSPSSSKKEPRFFFSTWTCVRRFKAALRLLFGTFPNSSKKEPKLLSDLRATIQGCLKPSFWHGSPNSSKKEPNHLRPATCRRLLPSLCLTFFPGYLQKASVCFSKTLPSPRLVLNNAGFLRSDSHPASASQHVADEVITSCICGKQSSAQMRHTPAYNSRAPWLPHRLLGTCSCCWQTCSDTITH